MDETKKTGIFGAVGLVTLLIGMFVSWPTKTVDDEGKSNTLLFEKFTDPLAAAQMKVVTFNEEQGELDEFIVRKNVDTELWTIESKADYPADAVEQVKKSANALISLKILDTQTTNAEDHANLGVVEPDLQKLQVGDEGVGRLVTLKNKDRETLASIIIGDALKDDPEKRYVRIPQQDPVYVVKFDPSSVTTEFQEWIEEDLLQLSSIEIGEVTIDDYSASISPQGKFNMERNYVATVKQEGSDWQLEKLGEYEASAIEPTEVAVDDGKSLNTAKLNDLKNALDDLEFVNVYRKPKGMSASLRANEDLLKDNESLSSLLTRGFYPVAMQASGEDREVEIVAANGELRVGTNSGVEYTLRFGNVNSVDQKSGEDAEGVNRYLLVTTSVDESQFPAPELAPIPESVEQLKAMQAALRAKPEDEPAEKEMEATEPAAEESAEPTSEEAAGDKNTADEKEAADDSEAEEMKGGDEATEETSQEPAESEGDETADAAEMKEESADKPSEEPAKEAAEEVSEEAAEGEATDSGSAEAEGSGPGQDEETSDEPAGETASGDDSEAGTPATEKESPQDADSEETAAADSEEPAAAEGEDMTELTEEEWQELLEAEQEKVTKSNQRLMDDRKDKMASAEQKVRELNERFADWYYVIPEGTYSKLRIRQSELFESESDAAGAAAPSPDAAMPNFNIPGLGQ